MNADDVDIPNPGSDAAIDDGCTCPVMDNGHEHRRDGRFVYAVGCPVHDKAALASSREPGKVETGRKD